jgi:purine-binding chemotaxis protein CheW
MQLDQRPGKYLTFKLGREVFGINVLRVREIMAVPQTPDFMHGEINLGGRAVPVIDLRLKFGLPATEYTKRTCIVVVQVEGEAGSILMGVLVDAASKVLNLTSSDIEDASDQGAKPAMSFIIGMAKVKGKATLLLDIDGAVGNQ